MPEELEVAAKVEIDSVVTEEQEEITRKEEIKWHHRPFNTIIDPSSSPQSTWPTSAGCKASS